MDILEAIKTRRSIRSFRTDPVPPEALREILEAATWAPSHRNAQPWELVMIGPETRQKLLPLLQQFLENGVLKTDLSETRRKLIQEFGKNFGNAPIILAALSRPADMAIDKEEYPQTVAIAVQNMMLAAWARGLGSVWLSLGVLPQVQEVLRVKNGYSIIAVIPIGYPNMQPEKPLRIAVEEKLIKLP